MTDKLRFGIVGCGVIGSTHAEAITSLPDAQLVAVCDAVPEKAHKLADKFGVTPYTELQEMLDRERLDVVDICTPSGLHGEQACQVIRSGRHVIVEKPIEISLPAIKEMLRVQRENNVKLAVISQHRFDAAAQQVHALVEEQAFGRLVMGNVIVPWWRSQPYYDSGAWRGTWGLDGDELTHLGRKSKGVIPCSCMNCQSNHVMYLGILEGIFTVLGIRKRIASCLMLPQLL